MAKPAVERRSWCCFNYVLHAPFAKLPLAPPQLARESKERQGAKQNKTKQKLLLVTWYQVPLGVSDVPKLTFFCNSLKIVLRNLQRIPLLGASSPVVLQYRYCCSKFLWSILHRFLFGGHSAPQDDLLGRDFSKMMKITYLSQSLHLGRY